MSTHEPNHPPFGQVRRLECRDGHVAGTWWRPSSDQPFSPVDEPAAGVDIGAPCPRCGLELDETHALIDGSDLLETGQEEL